MKHFYDPGFAVAAAVLSLVTWPMWMLVLGEPQAGNIATGLFALGVLVFMLWVSWSMAHEKL